MTSYDYEQANARLALISARDPQAKPVSQQDVDSIIWAVQELDSRNRDLRAALESDPNVTLTNEDVRGLENSVQNIREMYQWILAGHNSNQQQQAIATVQPQAVITPGNTTETNQVGGQQQQPVVDTLKSVSADTGVTVNELRLLNPELEELGASEPIPEHIQIRIPPTAQGDKVLAAASSSGATVSGPGTPGRRSRKASPGRTVGYEDDDASTTSTSSARWRHRGRDMRRRRAEEAMPDKLIDNEVTLAALSIQCRMPIEEILHQNPNLEVYETHEIIPFSEPIEIRRQELRTEDDDHNRGGPSIQSLTKSRPRSTDRRFTRTRQAAVDNQQADIITVTRGDSLYDIAQHLCRCPVGDIRDLNPELDDYGDRDILPTGVQVFVPTDPGTKLDRMREHERDYATSSTHPGRSPARTHVDRDDVGEDTVEVGSRQVRGADTLADLSAELDFPVEALRDANPATDRFDDNTRLPSRMLLTVPHESARAYFSGRGHQSKSVSAATGNRTVPPTSMYSRSGGTSFASSRKLDSNTQIYVTKAGDTLDALSRKWQCHPDDLVDGTAELQQYHDDDPLPKGITIMLPDNLPPPGDRHGRETYYSASVVRY